MIGQIQRLFAAPPAADWLALGASLAGILLFIAVVEIIRKRLQWSSEATRKLIHVAVGIFTSYSPNIFHEALPAILLGVIFIVLNAVTLRQQRLNSMHGTERVSYGTVLFPVAYVLLVVLFWYRQPVILILSMLVLTFGDSAAAMIGEGYKSPTIFHLTADKKSVQGSLAMFAISFAMLFMGIQRFSGGQNLQLDFALGLAFSGAAMATAWEALSSRGLDNLTIPLSVAFVLTCYIEPSPVFHAQLSMGALFGLFIVVASLYTRLLAPSGAVAAFILALLLYGLGGWKWTIPILTFFLLSSLLSKIGKQRKEALSGVFEKTSVRDYAQVAANGGVAGILVVLAYLFPGFDFYPLYLGSLAAVTADTWGTEVGLLANAEPMLVTTFKKVSRGTNGGVTVVGILAGALGAAVIALSAQPWMAGRSYGIAVILAGVAGALVDSILGATLQAQYRCEVCQITTERTIHHDAPTVLVRGYRHLNNDAVNWACAIAGAVVMILITLV